MGNAVYKAFLPLVLTGAAVLATVGGWRGHSATVPAPAVHPLSVQRSFADLPLAFEPNRGQSDPAVLFQSRMAGYSLYLTADEAVIGVRGVERPLRLTWQGTGSHPDVAGLDRLPGKHHYLKGSNPARWHRDIPTYGKVRYRNLYPGIDLVYYGRDRRLEYDLVVAPGADPKQIRLTLSGMDRMQIDRDGAVEVQLAQQHLSLSKPVIYQQGDAGRQPVDGGYVRLADNRLGLRIGRYDATRPLIIDPVLSFSTYLGGTGAEFGRGVAVVPNGDVYVVGQTTSRDITFSNGIKASSDIDVLLAQFDSSGTLQAVVYLGGSGADRGFGVAANGSAVYIVGDTTSTDFPVFPNSGAAQATNKGNADAFVAKLNSADLSSAYVTYLGGTQAEEALGVAVDGAGNTYVAGATLSSDFPKTLGTFNGGDTTGACTDQTNATIPCSDAFIAKYDASGNLSYATYLGGKLEDTANAIAVDNAGEVFVTGLAYSSNAAFSSGFKGQPSDAFIAVLNSSGSFAHGIYVGGTGFDQGQAIAVDVSGNTIYMAGITNSTDLPVTNEFQAIFKQGGLDGFVVKLNYDPTAAPPNTLFQTQYLTYLGGSPQSQTQAQLNDGQDQIYGIAADAGGNAYVVGETMSADFPVQLPLQALWFGGGSNGWGDAFVTKFNPSGGLAWSTLLGGSDDDWANGVALDGNGGVYVAGSSFSSDFPTTVNPYQAANQGGGDAFLFKLTDNPALNADLKVDVSGTPDLVGTGETITYKMVVSNQSTLNNADGVVVRATLPAGVSYQSATPANSCTSSGQQLTCRVGSIPVGGSATTTVSAVNNTAGDITFTAQVVRAFQPDPTPGDNTASITTKAALGSSSGGGSWPPLAVVVLLVYGLGRRSGRLSSRALK
jgi:uncharacterized repeat protein (TIGR01451 family)